MFKIGMTIADMDRVFIGKRNTTGYDNIEIVQSLSYNELQYYDKIFKQEQGVHGELSNEDLKQLSSIGNIILQEKLRRDNEKVFGKSFL